MPHSRTIVLSAIAMLAFAGNSVLCRLALAESDIDAASFTSIRLVSGAVFLWMLVSVQHRQHRSKKVGGDWISALALFAYAAGFSFAYISLPAASGALVLFGAVQASMIGYAIWSGERLAKAQLLGLGLAFGGLIALLVPGLSAPPLFGSLVMLLAGIAWAVYSLRGRSVVNPTVATAGNFLRAVPLTLALNFVMFDGRSIDTAGAIYAIASGVLTSGAGYAIWYAVLPNLKASNAATIQLSVPVITAVGGVAFLGESISLRLALTSAAILGGIALVIFGTNDAKQRK